MRMYLRAPTCTLLVGDSSPEFVPSWIKLQLRHHIGQGITVLEAEILDELDRLIGSPEGLGRRQPIATWSCLWILILAYRSHFHFIYFYFHEDDSFCRPRFALGKHIHNALTSIYSALFKATSPLTLDWRTDEVAQMLGNDPELIRLFCNIKAEMFWFCEYS